MQIALAGLDPKQKYKLIASAIMPRPIALVTSLNENGTCNAAPFSAFNYLSEDPPTVALGVTPFGDDSRRQGGTKDTARNIVERLQFTINFVDEPLLPAVATCAREFAADVSEPGQAGLTLVASSTLGRAPRIAQSPIAMECTFLMNVPLDGPRLIIIANIVSMYFRDDLFDPASLRIDLDRYHPIGRLTGDLYCTTRQRISAPVRRHVESAPT